MRWKKLVSFTGMIWLLVAAISLHALCWPLVENTWAYYRWERVPCKVLDRPGYTFLYQDKAYIGTRIDFWDRRPVHASETGVIARDFDRFCYIAPGDPTDSVLNLDAYHHPEGALHFLDRILLACCVAGILTYAVRRKTVKSIR